ncbi:hypothetical protein LDO26_06355 [Luteimonas sp. BDR2-5]|uniref:hypothetical protein n=1 Tax=Proluteimonas luteida TaxID=2878685 RepID=UPI001E5E8570|nr:hypothetical protein [Luteimonas sp. BDR2-5]MCD9027825.1 hypothetical protein [Luteimonas sp. BDR2-5]
MRIFRELLFLHGHVVDPALARQLDADDPPVTGSATPASTPAAVCEADHPRSTSCDDHDGDAIAARGRLAALSRCT